MSVKFVAKKMTAINEILLPVLLFVVYFFIAIQLLPQHTTAIKKQINPVTIEIEIPAKTLEEFVDCSQLSLAMFQGRFAASVSSDALISRDFLDTQSLANLKAIAAELYITPSNDKRSKLTWIDAIASSTPENTVLAVDLCYA